MNNKPVLYGVIGLLVGVGIATYAASSAVNTGNASMMRMMGIRQGEMMGPQQQGTMGMGSSMEEMMESMQGKTADAFDRAFIESMIIHHQGAVGMARLAQQYAKHDELRALADEIIDAQTREIEQMRAWQQAWE